MKSIEKLRHYFKGLRHYFKGEGAEFVTVNRLIDDVEKELNEQYIKLPKDADGVPIRPGDEMRTGCDDVLVVSVAEDKFFVNRGGYTASDCVHTPPLSLEDVLRRMLHEYLATDMKSTCMVGKYAEYIRELMEVDR